MNFQVKRGNLVQRYNDTEINNMWVVHNYLSKEDYQNTKFDPNLCRFQ